MSRQNGPQHIGIVACSAEGAALCYRTICAEGAGLLGPHAHPEISLHAPSLAAYMERLARGDWPGVAALMLASADKLAQAGADFLICPDNTIHQALPLVADRLPRPWLHIAEVVAAEAVERGYRRLGLTGTRWLMLAVPLILLINRLSGYTVVMLLGSPVMNVSIALLIESSTRHSDSLAGRFLNWKPIAFLGVLSYSLYLWQQPFLDRYSHSWVTAFPQNLVLAFVAALLSYHVVERSFLGLRRRLERTTSLPVHTDSIPDVSAKAEPTRN